MANRNDYTNKEKVIAKFNESVEHANSYFAHASDDHSHETVALLNAAGSELYECFENGMKYVIVKHFEQLVQKGVRIEKNRIEKRVKGKTRYQLIQEIKKIGIPQLNGDNILLQIFCKNPQNLVKQRITPHFLIADHPNYYEFTTKG